jgi:S1-C subfamily serine protease
MKTNKLNLTSPKTAFITLIAANCIFCAHLSAQLEPQKTLEKSVVMITSVKQDFNYTAPWKQTPMTRGVGSGFVIDGKRIITNAHNVSNYRYIEVKKQNLPKRYPATVTFIAHDCDLAIISITDNTFYDDIIPLQLGGLPKVHSTVETYGFAVGGRQVSFTEGVVSRVQMDLYSHSQADSHLVIQTDAAINPGNSGGPVMQNGKVVGVAFQGLIGAENIGYMIPTTVIKHFLADIEDGKYDGFGSIGFSFYPGLHNNSYADYLKIPPGQQGIVILSTMMHSSVENLFQPGDIITKIDDFDIDNDGMIKIYGLTLNLSEVIEQKQIAEKVKLTYYRNGEQKTATAQIALNRPILPYSRKFDQQPGYHVFAGLVFVPVSRNFLETWGPAWINDMPYYLRYLFHNSLQLNTDRKRKEYVVLSEILTDQANAYCEPFRNKVVQSVNDIEIHSLQDLAQALTKSGDDSCVIKFMATTTPLILDSELANLRNQPILDKYQLPAQSNLEKEI